MQCFVHICLFIGLYSTDRVNEKASKILVLYYYNSDYNSATKSGVSCALFVNGDIGGLRLALPTGYHLDGDHLDDSALEAIMAETYPRCRDLDLSLGSLACELGDDDISST